MDLEARVVRVIETTTELDRGGLVPEPPKSAAGRRTVSFPAELVPEPRSHLEQFTSARERGLVFTGPKGAPRDGRTSGPSGTPPRQRPRFQDSTFTTCAMSAGLWPKPAELHPAHHSAGSVNARYLRRSVRILGVGLTATGLRTVTDLRCHHSARISDSMMQPVSLHQATA